MQQSADPCGDNFCNRVLIFAPVVDTIRLDVAILRRLILFQRVALACAG